MDAGTSSPHDDAGAGYPGAAQVGATLATVFFPLIALIAALLLLGGQADPRKRSQLRTWAWVSGGWLALGLLLLVLLVAVGSGSSPGIQTITSP